MRVSLEGTRAATGDFPLGLPLAAQGESDFPLDLSIDFADLPGLADVLRRVASAQGVAYQFDGTFSIEAGVLGRPSFGPMRLFEGRLGRRRDTAGFAATARFTAPACSVPCSRKSPA